MKKIFKNNVKLILGISIGLLISAVSVYAVVNFNSSDVGFDNTTANLTLSNNSVDNVQDAIDAIYVKLANICPTGYEMVALGEYSLTCRNTSAPICKRAAAGTLHTETCNQGTNDNNYYCYYDGYSPEGSKGTTTITYGKLGQAGVKPEVGDAFDCDVNGDGQYNATTERFYYVSDYFDTNTKTFDTTRATLIYYRNFDGGIPSDNGVAYYGTSGSYNNWHGPTTAIAALPNNKANGGTWRNDLIKTGNRKILSCNAANCTTLTDSTTGGTITYTTPIYNGKAARLLTVKEANAGCGTSIGSSGSLSGDCNFLMERTNYANPSGYPTYGTWFENPVASSSTDTWTVVASVRRVYNYNTNITARGARPAIDILYSDILY